MASAQEIADALSRAGYTGDMDRALRIACGESGGNPSADNHYDARAGRYGVTPGCWGLFQFCNTNGEYGAVVGNASLDVQAAAFVRASGNGSNFGPWSSSNPRQTSQQCKDFAAGVTGHGGAAPTSSGGPLPDVLGMLKDAINKSLGEYFHRDSFATFVIEILIRAMEIQAGAIIMAIGGIVLLDIVSTPGTSQGTSMVRSTIRKTKQRIEQVAMMAAMA